MPDRCHSRLPSLCSASGRSADGGSSGTQCYAVDGVGVRENACSEPFINQERATNKKKVNSMPVEKQEPEYEFTRLGLAIVDALEEFDKASVEEIAACVGEPICLAQATL